MGKTKALTKVKEEHQDDEDDQEMQKYQKQENPLSPTSLGEICQNYNPHVLPNNSSTTIEAGNGREGVS